MSDYAFTYTPDPVSVQSEFGRFAPFIALLRRDSGVMLSAEQLRGAS